MPVEPIFLRPRAAAALAGLSTRAIYGAKVPLAPERVEAIRFGMLG